MGYIQGFNVRKENYEKRIEKLIENLDYGQIVEEEVKTRDIIINVLGDKVKQMPGKEFMMLFQDIIEDIYIENYYEEDLYYDWLYSYILRIFSSSTIEEFILECDGFFSHLAIYEIIDRLKSKSEENSEIKLYIESEKFTSLEKIYEELIDVFSVNMDTRYPYDRRIEEYILWLPSWTRYKDWDNDRYDCLGGRITSWIELNKMYSLQELLDEIANDIARIDGCRDLSEDLKELKESILPENTLKNEAEDIEDKRDKFSESPIRIDLPEALGVLAEARTKEMLYLNEQLEENGERIKIIIESGENLNEEEEEIKNNITRSMNREQALGEVISIYYGDEIMNYVEMRMPTHIIFSTLEEWVEELDKVDEIEESDREDHIFSEKLSISISLVLDRIKSTMEIEKENKDSPKKDIDNLEELLNFLGFIRSIEVNYVNEMNHMIEYEKDKDKKLEISSLVMKSISKEKALRKVYVRLTGNRELDYDNDGIIEIESAISILENWLDEPIETDDDDFKKFCRDKNKAIEIALCEIKKK